MQNIDWSKKKTLVVHIVYSFWPKFHLYKTDKISTTYRIVYCMIKVAENIFSRQFWFQLSLIFAENLSCLPTFASRSIKYLAAHLFDGNWFNLTYKFILYSLWWMVCQYVFSTFLDVSVWCDRCLIFHIRIQSCCSFSIAWSVHLFNEFIDDVLASLAGTCDELSASVW